MGALTHRYVLYPDSHQLRRVLIRGFYSLHGLGLGSPMIVTYTVKKQLQRWKDLSGRILVSVQHEARIRGT